VFGVTPGPGTFAILARALTVGAGRCIWLSLGMVLSDMVYLILACYGLATLAENWSGAFLAIRVAGASYLFYLAYKMWTAAVEKPGENPDGLVEDGVSSLIQGFMISASNPKVILFYLAFLPTFIDLTTLTTNAVIWVSFLQFVALLLALMAVAGGAASARKLFRSTTALQRMNRFAALLMATAAAYLALRA
jgi:threonine/homoserine/homoserine lactone efflux protein